MGPCPFLKGGPLLVFPSTLCWPAWSSSLLLQNCKGPLFIYLPLMLLGCLAPTHTYKELHVWHNNDDPPLIWYFYPCIIIQVMGSTCFVCFFKNFCDYIDSFVRYTRLLLYILVQKCILFWVINKNIYNEPLTLNAYTRTLRHWYPNIDNNFECLLGFTFLTYNIKLSNNNMKLV